MYSVEVSWTHKSSGVSMDDILYFDCDEDEKLDMADELCYHWYVNTVTEVACELYREFQIEMDDISLDDYLDDYFENCDYVYSF